MSDYKLYLDTETTGLDAKTCGLWQVAGIIEVNGERVHDFDLKFRPFDGAEIQDGALEVSPFNSEAEMRKFPNTDAEAFNAFLSILREHVDQYDRSQKFTLCGYNVAFDDNFIREWFIRNGDNWFGSFISPYKIDIYTLIALLHGDDRIPVAKLKLGDIAEHLNIHIDAHDAASDIEATYEIGKVIISKLLETKGSLLDWKKDYDDRS